MLSLLSKAKKLIQILSGLDLVKRAYKIYKLYSLIKNKAGKYGDKIPGWIDLILQHDPSLSDDMKGELVILKSHVREADHWVDMLP